ncbi:MAG TPA: NADH-quinone oxidoreductase subunit NuoF [Bacteroidales bacterium]|nr:NADH-quinone oxidoreductase subunit NuoF [Bacteroidales bacterium]
MAKKEILICAGTGCLSSGAEDIEQELIRLLEDRGLSEKYPVKEVVKTTGCVGPCSLGPIMIIMPEKTMYGNLKVEDVEKIVDEHIANDKIVESLVVKDDDHKVEDYNDLNFFKGQMRIALRNTGLIDPLSIDDYIGKDGYKALEKVLNQMEAKDVIDEIKESGLRGRGGAGFPTGLKWEFAYKEDNEQKYLICNADEGDPGAFMDRSILEGDPHSVIEAMTIAGYAIGSDQGFVYVRAEYPLAIKNLKNALKDARENNYLGENLFDSGFNFDIEIRVGAGAFVCGEETALIASIEGKRGQPSPKPPYPAQKGLWGKPTIINNVETFANIAPIILNGSEWFNGIGTENSNGTKVFAVAGDVIQTGLVEVPMGTTFREIVFDICGGIPDGKEFKAVQIGGPSGGTIPAKYLDMKVDYESLKEIGAIVGSGGLIVMDEDNCMVDVARFFLDFTRDESCGKCPPCRIGTKRMLEILERITQGKGEDGDIEKLQKLGQTIKETSLCGLGQTAPNPVLSTINFFRDEYEEHIYNKNCPARKCTGLTSCYKIDPEVCIGCSLCKKECPVDAISGETKEPHKIDCDTCIACGACEEVCPVDAIS